MNILRSLLEIILFLFAIMVCFYLPGKFLFTKLKLTLSSPENLFLPFTLGVTIFTLVAYVFSWAKLEIIILPIFLLISFFAFKNKKWLPARIEKFHRWPLIIVIALSSIFSLSMLMAGLYGNSISYRGDDLWHLALINEMKVNFPPDNPGFAGVPLRGYHFFYDFLLAKIINIFPISPLSLHFHFFPLFMAILWGLGVYSLVYKWSKRISVGLWAVFLTMFGGSFAFVLRLRGHEGLSLDSAFGIQQPASSLINPPFSISILIVLATLFATHQYLALRKNSWLIPIALFVGLATMFKVYAGIILISGFIFLSFLEVIRRKNYLILISLFASGVLFSVTYGIFRDPSSTLIFAPLWAPHDVLNSNMPWYGYAEKMYTYAKFSVIKGIIETELYSWYVFIFGNLGTRLIGLLFLLLFLFKQYKKPSLFASTILIMTAISILIPLFFIQSGKVFEIIQMAWYFLFFASLFAAFGFQMFFNLHYIKIIKIVLFIVIIVLTLPSAYEPYKSYFGNLGSRGSSLSDPYFKAMQFLRSEGDYNQTVLEIPDKSISATQKDLMRWYRSSSPAIVAFANKRSYLSNEYIDFMGTNIAPRIEFIRKIISFNNMSIGSSMYMNLKEEINHGLKDNKISFIYSPYPLISFEKIDFISKIYANQATIIYKVNTR